MTKNNSLPYEFDLLFDIKTYDEVDLVANYQHSASDASPEDLVELFQKHDLPIPDSLKSFVPVIHIWILPNGTWLDHEPLAHR